MSGASDRRIVLIDHSVFAAAAHETEQQRGPYQPEFPPGDRRYPALSCVVTLLHASLLAVNVEVLSTRQLLDLGLALHGQGGNSAALSAAEHLRKLLEQGYEDCFDDVPPHVDDRGGLLAAPVAAAQRVLDADFLVTTRDDLIGREKALGVQAVLTPHAWLLLASRLAGGLL